MVKILVIDDEPQIRRFLRIGLSSQGYDVLEANSGLSGQQMVTLNEPELVILDLGLPDMDGIEVLKAIREFFTGPVIILSVRNHESEKVVALDAGANDYIVKPFGINELLARIRVLLRTANPDQGVFIKYDDGTLLFDIPQHKVSLNGTPVHLSRKEFGLLKLLIEYSGRVVTQHQILDHLWGASHREDNHYLRILVGKLRAKLNDDPGAPKYIETEPGVGYRFLPQVTSDSGDE